MLEIDIILGKFWGYFNKILRKTWRNFEKICGNLLKPSEVFRKFLQINFLQIIGRFLIIFFLTFKRMSSRSFISQIYNCRPIFSEFSQNFLPFLNLPKFWGKLEEEILRKSPIKTFWGNFQKISRNKNFQIFVKLFYEDIKEIL